MGFVEETGAAQHYVTPVSPPFTKATTGIQAADLAGRKLIMDKGQAMLELIADMHKVEEQLGKAGGDDLAVIKASLGQGIEALNSATQWMLATTMAQDAPS